MSLAEVRKRAWATRRERYGPRGHGGAYTRPSPAVQRNALAYVVRLHRDGTLSEGQCCKALDMDRVAFRALCDEAQP